MWDIAAKFKAKFVFAEHRYYGESLPFGNKSLDNQHIGYLTSAQALADYADLVNHLQGDAVNLKYPVIAFGGSYGGMLAAYFRIKYPHLVAGEIASSAPVHMYPGMVPCELFNEIATDSYKIANSKCPDNIRRSWSVLRSYVACANTSQWLRQSWNLCGPTNSPIDVEFLVQFLKSM
ncbi:hypothetical protein O3G_MSEX004202 [Manduca sexta]|uniref:Lysosomal Pro-X carboxypeptidase n=1 Tax=Manduca sexta TaxID=7130 RepID=A0A921YV26_MANSE|nr:hypothetical protein O3G_MSEX004202 [Manduca sexta]